ncbi:MAG TPA: hypothetical protein VF715_17430 [Thermoleophilaceae bacterium]|jgi:hypothetical protein
MVEHIDQFSIVIAECHRSRLSSSPDGKHARGLQTIAAPQPSGGDEG